jgi:hypothetical protein
MYSNKEQGNKSRSLECEKLQVTQWSFESEPAILFQTQAYKRQNVDAMIINDTSIYTTHQDL